MKLLLEGIEWWSRNRDVGASQKSPSYLAPGSLRNTVKSIFPSFPWDLRHSHSVGISISQSLSLTPIPRSAPIQHSAVTEDTAPPLLQSPVSMPVSRGGQRSSGTSPGSCWRLSLLPSWEALAKAIFLYPYPCLNGESAGFWAGRNSFSKILHRCETQLFGDILKQKEIKDRKGSGNLTSPKEQSGGGRGMASTQQGGSWNSENSPVRRKALTSGGPQWNQ